MGGRICRTLFATLSALALLSSSIGGASTALAADTCADSPYAAPPPGAAYAEADAVVISVTWANADAMQLLYVVTDSADPVNDPIGGIRDTAVSAGCTSEAIISGCVSPLILTTSVSEPRNQAELGVGRYTIVAEPGGACVYYTGDGGKPEYATAPAEIPVTATIELYRAGERTPSFATTLDPVMVPTLEEVPMDTTQYRRILGAFDWDPAVGITPTAGASAGGEDGSQVAAVPGLGPGTGTTVVGAPPDSYGDSPELDATDDAEVAEDSQDEVSAPPLRRDLTNAEMLFVVLVALLVNPEKVLKALLSGGLVDFVLNVEAMLNLEAEKDPDVLEALEGDPSSDESEPSGTTSIGPPDTKLKPGRRWVQPGQEFSVRHDGEKHDLLLGVWYQAKEVDGKLRLFDQDGRLLGSVKASGPEAPMLWSKRSGRGDPSSDESAGVDDTTQPSQAAPIPGYEKLPFKPETATDLMRYLFAFQVVDERLPQAQRDKAERQLELFNQMVLPEGQ